MEELMNDMVRRIDTLRAQISAKTGMDPVEHCTCRIKEEESMREKCRRQGLPETEESALKVIHDAIGLRIVCAFLDDVYTVKDYLAAFPDLEVLVDVTNTGGCDGDEVVQLYVRDLQGSTVRPRKQLRAFRRVSIPAGETVTVSLPLGAEAFELVDAAYERVIEPGTFELQVGASSEDIRLSTEISYNQ